MSTIDVRAWVTGDISSLLNTINSPNDIRAIANLLSDASCPEKNKLVLSGLLTKFGIGGNGISIPLWMLMITVTDNVELFEHFYLATLGNLEHDMQSVIAQVAQSSACSWKFCQINQIHQQLILNCNSWEIFSNAVHYCMRTTNVNLSWYRLLQIWNVPILWRFQVSTIVCNRFDEYQLDILYPLKDLHSFLEIYKVTPNIQPKLLPIITQIINHRDQIIWTIDHQIQLLTELYENSTDPIGVGVDHTDILQKTMLMFDPFSQRDIWNGLTEDCRNHYEELDWTLIDDQVVPCFSTMGITLYRLLQQKKRLYDYQDELIEYCKLNHIVLLDALENGLVSVEQPKLWTDGTFGHLKELITFWIDHLTNTSITDPVERNIIACLEKQDNTGMQLKSEVLKHIDIIADHVPTDSKLFRVLLRDPLPLNFQPSIKLRNHILLYNPTLINVHFYNSFKEQTITAIQTGSVELNWELSERILSDILTSQIPFNAGLINAIPLATWTDPRFKFNEKLLRDLVSGRTDVPPEILFEVSYRCGQSITATPTEIKQFLIQWHGLGTVDVIEDVLMLLPFPLTITRFEKDYRNLLLIYEHYRDCGALNMLSISKEVLLDLLLKNPDSTSAQQMFMNKCTFQYDLTDEIIKSIPATCLVDFYIAGYLKIPLKQYKSIPKPLKEVCLPTCGVCRISLKGTPQGSLVQLPCGHAQHATCYHDIWLNQKVEDDCPNCVMNKVKN